MAEIEVNPAIALGSDHAGFPLKSALVAYLLESGRRVVDLGVHGTDRVDYPDYGYAVADAVLAGQAALGVVVCGTGIGISIAANRRPGIRAALCHDVTTARMARAHNDANILALGGRMIGEGLATEMLGVFLSTAYEGGRHDIRIAKL